MRSGHYRITIKRFINADTEKGDISKFPIQKVLSYEISVDDGVIDLPRGLEPKDY